MTTQTTPRVSSFGDRTVDGLFAGLISGAVMAACLQLTAFLSGGWLEGLSGFAP